MLIDTYIIMCNFRCIKRIFDYLRLNFEFELYFHFILNLSIISTLLECNERNPDGIVHLYPKKTLRMRFFF